MKKCIALLLILTCFFLWGCESAEPNGVSFYYSRHPDQFQYFQDDSVITSEIRDLAGHRNDLRYMVGLYLAGPLEEGLANPFPKTIHLINVEQEEGRITITLSGHSSILSDSEFTLGCTCLALTCMNFTECTQVTVTSGTRTITLERNNILLADTLQQASNGG